MAVWSQLDVDKTHVSYAVTAVCSLVFASISLFMKERVFIGEASTSTILGVIVGPKSLNWFNPLVWSSNPNYLIQEISRIVLIIQIFAVSVELPPKYMQHHFKSVAILLFFGMTFGWLITALFIYVLFSRLNFADALLISGCVTATDPVLAAAIVGKGKFGQRVPAHLKNLLSAESGANDGMAFPFVLLAVELVSRYGHAGQIVKQWIVVSILYECVFGTLLGIVIGYCGRELIKFCELHNLVDRESFLVFYILLSLMCTGFGSILGVDDLLVSFAAGAAFAWDGWFKQKTEDSNLSSIVDLLLNLCYFLFLGAIIPWSDFNNTDLGLNVWRLIVLGIIIIFLRRIPIFLAMKPFVSEFRSWKDAFFCGHFGPIGVGGIFCSMIAISNLEAKYTKEETPMAEWSAQHAYLVRVLWPIVTFLVVTSIIIHGTSVTIIILTNRVKHINFTVKNVDQNIVGPSIEENSSDINKTQQTDERFSVHHLKKRSSRDNAAKKLTNETRLGPIALTDNVAQMPDRREMTVIPEYFYVQGNDAVVEDHDGEVLDEFEYNTGKDNQLPFSLIGWIKKLFKNTIDDEYNVNVDEKNGKKLNKLDNHTLSAYQSGNEILVENDDGVIIRRYMVKTTGDEENQNFEITPAANRVNNHHTSQYNEEDIRREVNEMI